MGTVAGSVWGIAAAGSGAERTAEKAGNAWGRPAGRTASAAEASTAATAGGG